MTTPQGVLQLALAEFESESKSPEILPENEIALESHDCEPPVSFIGVAVEMQREFGLNPWNGDVPAHGVGRHRIDFR